MCFIDTIKNMAPSGIAFIGIPFILLNNFAQKPSEQIHQVLLPIVNVVNCICQTFVCLQYVSEDHAKRTLKYF